MAVIIPQVVTEDRAGGAKILGGSLRFNSASSHYLNRTPASASNRKTWTWSGWVKRSTLTTAQWLFGAGPVSTDYTLIRFGSGGSSNDHLEYTRVVGSAVDAQKISSAVYRDTSAWYHIVVVEDAVNTVARVYVNGSEIAYSTNDNPSNVNGAVNNTGSHEIGRYVGSAVNLFNGYLTEINFIDGYAYDPSYFGETDTLTGVWKPKKYTGTYGTNGFYLKFADNSGTTAATLGKDSSGNGNNFTPNNFSVTAGAGNDSLIDTPTPYADGGNGRGNYCTLNPLDYVNSTFSNGNLDTVVGTGSGSLAFGNFQMKSGKWYW
ncbi:MAG: LamG domain-containing protein, partial [Ignavibacteria bacterium]|nr:LamG domain-containing protein [Ignavibacteria bacterium]